MSIPPSESSVAAIRLATAAGSRRSALDERARTPWSRSTPARIASSAAPSSRPWTTTSHPSAARRLAVARPRPRVEPVISARFPESGRCMVKRTWLPPSGGRMYRSLLRDLRSLRALRGSRSRSMTLRVFTTVGALAIVIGWLGIAVSGQAPAGYTAPRTPWGDPDIQGLFTTDDELGVPFERPATMGTRQTVTDIEFAEREAQAARQAATDAEEFVAPRAAPAGRG